MYFLGSENYKSDTDRLKQMDWLFDEYDYLSDSARDETLCVWTNEEAIAADADLKVFSQAYQGPKSKEIMLEGLKKVGFGPLYSDFYSSQDTVMHLACSEHRHRVFTIDNRTIIRVEMSRELLY